MLKKLFLSLFVLSCGLSSPAANWQTEITMLVVPREPVLVQIAQDISRRYPVLLVCYQQSGGRTAIHAWNGGSWIALPEEAYARGEFFKLRPRHAVIVEQEKGAAPDILIPDGTWCESGNRLASTDPRAVIHLLGRHFDFSYSRWMEFCRSYNYELEAVNPALVNVSWWNIRGKGVLPEQEVHSYKADMTQWLYLDSSPALPEEPAEPETVEEDAGEAPTPAEPPVEELIGDMFEEEAAPAEAVPDEDAAVAPVADIAEPEQTPEAIEVPEPEETPEVPAKEPVEKSTEVKKIKQPRFTQLKAAKDPEVAEEKKEPAAVDANPFSTNDIPAAKIIRLSK